MPLSSGSTTDACTQPVANQMVELVNDTCTLTVVPPPFIVFLSRLEYGTKPSDVASYINSKGIDIGNTRCQCLTRENLPGRISSSFKIYTTGLIGKKLLDTNFWPPGVLIREFSPKVNVGIKPKNLMNLRSSTKTLEV